MLNQNHTLAEQIENVISNLSRAKLSQIVKLLSEKVQISV